MMLAPAAAFLVALLGILIGPSPRAARDARREGLPSALQEQAPSTRPPAVDKIRIALRSSPLEDRTVYSFTFDLEGEGKPLHRARLAVYAGQWATVSIGDFKKMSFFCDAPSGFGPMMEQDPEPRPRDFQVAKSALILTVNAEEPREGSSKVSFRFYRFEDMAPVQTIRKDLLIPLGEETTVEVK